MTLRVVSFAECADLQRRILEEKQRQKRLLTGGIRLNDPPKENLNRTIISRSGNSNREFYAYDGPLSFGPDDPDRISPSIAGPTIITVRGVTPPTVQRFEFFQFIMRKNFFTKFFHINKPRKLLEKKIFFSSEYVATVEQ